MMKSLVYTLYAMPTNEKNIDIVTKENYHRITKDYVLCYTTNRLDNAGIINEEHYDALSETDKEWLYESNISIMKNLEIEHKDSIEKGKLKFLEELDKNLAEEKKAGNYE